LGVFRQKQDDWHATPAVDAQLRDQFGIPGALDEAQIDFRGIGFSDSMNQRALLNAIAAPDATEDQNLHLPHEAAHQLLLGFGQSCGIVDLIPAALLLGGAGPKITVVGKPGCKSIGMYEASIIAAVPTLRIVTQPVPS
jgi:hypothetical protein